MAKHKEVIISADLISQQTHDYGNTEMITLWFHTE